MRLPIRKSERLKTDKDDGPLYLTQEGLEQLKRKLIRIETHELPKAIEDVRITAEFGDFSENAEYQEAKARMRRLHGQVFHLKDKIQRSVLIRTDVTQAMVQLGSTVVLEKDGIYKTFYIVGPHEADPARGYISYKSPLGSSLLGHQENEIISGYLIKQIQ